MSVKSRADHVGTICVLGKVTRVWLEGAERLSVEQVQDKPHENHPIGLIQPLVSVKSNTGEIERGISQYPRLAAQVYAAHPELVAFILANKAVNQQSIDLQLGHLPNNVLTSIHASPEQLFARHCAVLGSTGSGKSNTVAKLIELVEQNFGKALLIDATGEYAGLRNCESYIVGNSEENSEFLHFPYWELLESDLYGLLKPSGQVQLPKLAGAIRSLKVVNILNNGHSTYKKEGTKKIDFESNLIRIDSSTFWDIKNLPEQILLECINYDANFGKDPSTFGNVNQNECLWCSSLIERVKFILNNSSMRWLTPSSYCTNTVKTILKNFISSEKRILRLDLSKVPFESNAREILVNAIGRTLLGFAREALINKQRPLLVFIDEAHQFLNKTIGDENTKFTLDSFGNIAKEGRKYGLNVAIATQRPRDIPEDVLSQIGTFIVHRLTNPYDQDLVKKAIGDLDYNTANSLPTLATGEALLLGVDFNFAMRLKIHRPLKKPQSDSANYSSLWINNSNEYWSSVAEDNDFEFAREQLHDAQQMSETP